MRSLILLVLLMSSGCGSSAPGVNQTIHTGNGDIVINVFNSGTQDPSSGTQYHMTDNVLVSIPALILRSKGTTDQNGVGVGVDFGGIQCYYYADTQIQNVFTFYLCSNGGLVGDKLKYGIGDVISVWSYVHVNSSDSVVELVLEGIAQ